MYPLTKVFYCLLLATNGGLNEQKLQDFQPQEVLLAEFNPILERKRNNGEENIVSGLGKHTPIYVLEKIYP